MQKTVRDNGLEKNFQYYQFFNEEQGMVVILSPQANTWKHELRLVER